METVEQDINNVDEQPVKTFTQEEVDAIVGERLKRDRAKYADYDALKAKAARFDEIEESNKTELQKATERATALQTELDALKSANAIREIRAEVAEKTGVPAHLITATTVEECEQQAAAILEYAKPGAYPAIRDGGEITKPRKRSTRDQFADWAEQAFRR